ncbi:dipeptidase [Alphaproteobacteria bacterium]|nr:dipeptidase [Alphaproteobacteria bacterium]MDB9800417.1 dipeptidase [Alphaproteobacteria bacterium]MDB9870125.1 dipeptidase [Alphaproteobacteria bacterium]MDC0134688.1 dipeptidase [Alphaproteobacteria bacterium]
MLIDGLQYCNWSEKIFKQWRKSNLTAVHVTISYHEQFRETVSNFEQWNRWFEQFPHLITPAYYAEDIEIAQKENKTAVIFGFQNPAPIEDDIGLIEILHRLGGRFMQLSYNNQSLLATGCYEENDPGITRMGKEVIKEMNRVGMVIDMSHSSERSTFEAIELSSRPIVISHANPSFWHPAKRNKSNNILKKLAENNGMLGFSLYPHHLNNSSNCSIEDFCSMIAKTADLMGVDNIGFGSDLCQDQPDGIVEWMRVGKWTKEMDYGEGSASNPGFPDMPLWFKDNRDWNQIIEGLEKFGFSSKEINKIKGENWLQFFRKSFTLE